VLANSEHRSKRRLGTRLLYGATVLALVACAKPKSAPTASCVHGCDEVERITPCTTAANAIRLADVARHVGQRVTVAGRLALYTRGSLLINCDCCGGWVSPRLALTERGGFASTAQPVVLFEGPIKAGGRAPRSSECFTTPGTFVLRYQREGRSVSSLGFPNSSLLVDDVAFAGKRRAELAGLGDRITNYCCSVDAADGPVVATGDVVLLDDPAGERKVPALAQASLCATAAR
jgi:hypothetical protein